MITRPNASYDWQEHFTTIKGNHTIKIGGQFQDAYTKSRRDRARYSFGFLLLRVLLLRRGGKLQSSNLRALWTYPKQSGCCAERVVVGNDPTIAAEFSGNQQPYFPKIAWSLCARQLESENPISLWS